MWLFRERLSEKVHAAIPKDIVGGFEFTVLKRNLKEWPRKAMDVCLRGKQGKQPKQVRQLQYEEQSIQSYLITFWDCHVHIFSDNLSRNSRIQR